MLTIAITDQYAYSELYRFVDSDTPAGEYLAPLVVVSKRGRAKVIDLTPLGRKVASRIRAGSLPS